MRLHNIDFDCVSMCEWQHNFSDGCMIVLYLFNDGASRAEIRRKNKNNNWYLSSESKLQNSLWLAVFFALFNENRNQ